MTGQLVLEAVSKTYQRGLDSRGGAVCAAATISLNFGPGEFVGIVGPNGAGKSTLLRLGAGVAVPDQGRVRRRGRTVALIELGAGVHPELSGLQNLRFLSALAGLSRTGFRRHRDDMIDFSGLAGDIDRPTKHYSSGMLARLAFAATVHARPDLLLLDEVLSVGDLVFQQQCLDRIRRFHEDGTTVVMVSHEMQQITQLCARAVHLDGGHVVDDGRAVAVVRRYLGQSGATVAGPVRVSFVQDEYTVGQDGAVIVAVELEVDRTIEDSLVGIEVVLPVHPGGVLDERFSGPLVIGTTIPERLDLPGGTHRQQVAVDGRGLPSGRLELRYTVEVPGESEAFIGEVPLVVPGSLRGGQHVGLAVNWGSVR